LRNRNQCCVCVDSEETREEVPYKHLILRQKPNPSQNMVFAASNQRATKILTKKVALTPFRVAERKCVTYMTIGQRRPYLDAKEVTDALRVDHSENILLSIAWVTNKGVRFFRLFPELTFWDTQQKTNRERRPCFLGCVKDSENRCFIYLRALMPSNTHIDTDWSSS
jgi:hypothetical protein